MTADTTKSKEDEEEAAALRLKLAKYKERLAAMKQQQALKQGKKEVTAWVRTASTRNLKLDGLEDLKDDGLDKEVDDTEVAGVSGEAVVTKADDATTATTSTKPTSDKGDSNDSDSKKIKSAKAKSTKSNSQTIIAVDHILMLRSIDSGNRAQKQHQDRAVQMFTALDIPHQSLDCSLPEHKEQRDKLFQISGVRGNYPQFFTCCLLTQDDDDDDAPTQPKYEYVGQFYNMQQINENSAMDPALLMPFDMTWDKLMGTTDTQLYYYRVLDWKRSTDSRRQSGVVSPAATETKDEMLVETTSEVPKASESVETTGDAKEGAVKVIQQFLKSRSPWWKAYHKKKTELEFVLSAIPQETKEELEKIQTDTQRQKDEFNAEDDEMQAVETSQKNAKKLVKKIEQEKKKEIQYQKEHQHELKRNKLIKKVNKLQEKTDKQKASFFKIKNKVFKQQGTARRLEDNIEQVVHDNQKILSVIQAVAEKLDEHNLSWNEIKQADAAPQPAPVAKKQWWVPDNSTKNAKPSTPSTPSAPAVPSTIEVKNEEATDTIATGETVPRVSRSTAGRKHLTKKEASKRALMLEASSQPSAVWSRSGGGTGGSGGASRRATLLLGGLAKQKKAELDASLHK